MSVAGSGSGGSPSPAAANSSTAPATPSIAVFLFAKEKLLFRYPDTDPFVVDVASPGSSSSNNTAGSSGSTDTASKQKSGSAGTSSASNANTNNSSSGGGGGGSGTNAVSNSGVSAVNNAEGGAGAGSNRGEAAAAAAAAATSASPAAAGATSRDRHAQRNSGSGTLHPDSLAGYAASSAAAAAGGGNSGGRQKKKSPHLHVTLAADVKDKRGNSPKVPGGAAGTTTATAFAAAAGHADGAGSSSSGVAPQRGMRRPASAYTLVNDNLTPTAAGHAHGSHTGLHRTTSPGNAANSSGTGGLEGRRGSHVKGSHSSSGATLGGMTVSTAASGSTTTTTQVQHTSTGSTRRQLSSNSPGGSSHGSSASPSSRGGSGKANHWANSRAAAILQQQQQQQQHSTGAATCVGIATNVLMHLLRGALNGCTTINMVNCTFLVFPLMLASPPAHAGGGGVHVPFAGASGHLSDALAAALDRQRAQQRSGTALLVVAMKQPDTDSGSIANFAQSFVNILCREEQRCHYVSAELDRMEALANHWEVGGAAAMAAAAAAADTRPSSSGSAVLHHQHLQQQQHYHSSSPHRKSSAAASATAVATTLSPNSTHDEQTGPASRTHGDYDYLFAPSRPALRSRVAAAAGLPPTGSAATGSGAFSSGIHGGGGSRVNAHGSYGGSGGSFAGQQHRDVSPAAASWTDAEYDVDAEEGGNSVRRAGGGPYAHSFAAARAASPLSGRDGGASTSNGSGSSSSAMRRRLGSGGVGAGLPPGTASPSSSSSSSSVYQQLAGYVRLAAEMQLVAQCIDLWNQTIRALTAGDDGGGRRRLSRLTLRQVYKLDNACRAAEQLRLPSVSSRGRTQSGTSGNGNGAAASSGPVIRDPLQWYSSGGSSSGSNNQQQQSWSSAAPGDALDTLPDALLINQMLLLPLSHLTGQERLEQEHTVRSAYSRVHPCSVVTVEEGQFTEALQRSYVDMMGRRYAKLIPLSTVYALLQALPSPRRAGSLYRSIELTLLEAVQRRHAKAAAAAAAAASIAGNGAAAPTTAAQPPPSHASPLAGVSMSAGNTSYPSALYATAGRPTRDSAAGVAVPAATSLPDEESSAMAAAAATTAAGLDFLAMEVIDFLRVNGAVSVASEMWVCFTHGEVTPVEVVEAAAERRRRHRQKKERRQRRRQMSDAETAAAAAAAVVAGGQERRGTHSDSAGTASLSPSTGGGTHVNNYSWASSDATGMELSLHGRAAPAPAVGVSGTHTSLPPANTETKDDPFDAVRDMDTVPAALVLLMLERVVDAQHAAPPHVPTSASASSLHNAMAARYPADAETLSTVTTLTTATAVAGGGPGAVPKSPSTGNTTQVAATLMAQTPRSTETDSSMGGRASFRTAAPTEASGGGGKGAAAATRASLSTASSPSLSHHTASAHTSGRVDDGASAAVHESQASPATQQQQQTTLTTALPAVRLAVYCAWGSACPLCEQLDVHPDCWTTAPSRLYTLGYYTLGGSGTSAPARRKLNGGGSSISGGGALQLDFPSLDASVRTCARHARRIHRDHADLASLMQSTYSISGGSSAAGQRAGGGSSGLLHSLQPWFVRPHMFVTPITTAYGATPFEIYERMAFHSARNAAGALRQMDAGFTAGHSGSEGSGAALQGGAHGSAAASSTVPVNNTSSLVEPERRDMLMAPRAQASAQESAAVSPTAAAAAATAGASSRRGAVVGAAEEQGHTLLQCSDIPAAAVDYLRRNAEVVRRRLAYSRSQQLLLARYEQAREHGGLQGRSTAAAAEVAGGGGVAVGSGDRPSQRSVSSPSVEDAASEATTTATAAASSSAAGHVVARSAALAIAVPSSASLAVAAVPAAAHAEPSDSTAADKSSPRSGGAVSAAVPLPGRQTDEARPSSPLSSSVGLARLGSSVSSSVADAARPRSVRYGRRQLPLHTATSPLTNVNLLFHSSTPVQTSVAALVHREGEEEKGEGGGGGGGGATMTATTTATTAIRATKSEAEAASHADAQSLVADGKLSGGVIAASPYAGMRDLLDGDRSLPVEVLLQYVLHHLLALSWGRRGVEVDTLVRLLERNLRRLPPLLANLQYVRQLRAAGFTSELAAAAVAASRAPAAAADPSAVAQPSPSTSSVFTTVHTRLAATALSTPAMAGSSSGGGVGGGYAGLRPSPSALAESQDDGSDTSPYSGGSRGGVGPGMAVTASEVQLLQAYEVVERLSLLEVLSGYATWPVRTVPTRLLLHTVVNEFSDVLYVDSSERDDEADHWDLPVAAQ